MMDTYMIFPLEVVSFIHPMPDRHCDWTRQKSDLVPNSSELDNFLRAGCLVTGIDGLFCPTSSVFRKFLSFVTLRIEASQHRNQQSDQPPSR